jgi:hypothetical protein
LVHYADIFPSTLIEEQPLQSLSGTFQALHADIGAQIFIGMSHSQLLQNRIFFYSHSYRIPKNSEGYGKLEVVETPSLSSLEWPEPDKWSVLSFKQNMVSNIQSSLKFGKASRSVGLSWYCPIHVFVHLFRALPLKQTPTMFVCKDVEFADLDSLLGESWGFVDGVHDGDRFRCNVGNTGIGLRYLKSRATLYIRFFYERWMYKRGKWVPLQIFEANIQTFDIVINMPNGVLETVQVSKHWTLANLREHLIIMGLEDVHNLTFRLNKHKVGSSPFLQASILI